MKFEIAPLKGSLMVASIVGMVISINFWDRFPSYVFAFNLVFIILFISTLISMTYAPVEGYGFKVFEEEDKKILDNNNKEKKK
jgi:hypothetical protein